jgi:outer membrane protein assembly factor BamA
MRLLLYIFCFLPSLLVYSQNPTIEKITLYGNNRTKDHTILRELILQEGKTFSSDLLQKDRTWLLRQGFLKRIEFLTKVGSTKDQRILIMVVQEKGTWSVSPILSNNDLFGWYSGIHLSTHNLWGRRNHMVATFQIGGYQKLAFLWEYPWFAGKLHLFTQFNIYHLSFRYLYGDFFPHFDETDTGIKFALGKGIGRKWKIGIRCGMEQIWVRDPSVTFSGTHKDNISLLETFAVLDTRDCRN